MKKLYAAIILIMLIVPLPTMAEIPDSLDVVKVKLSELLKGIEMCEKSIVTSVDLDFYNSRLEQLRDSRKRLQSTYPLSDYDELWNLVARFDNCDRRISERVAEWERKRQCIILIEKMNGYSHSMDSLLEAGKEYASRKSADSVISIKRRADDLWSNLVSLRASAEKEFEGDTLKALYKHVEDVRGEIQDLSEKEKIKVRDILLVVAAVVAAVAMLLTLVRSFSITKKSKETPSIEI
ncbi:MAG: hypothetical protein J6Y98_05220 [Bacteroidales bacterium]|nr:hypothetical protein [Bacteroidales bacterium]